MLRSFRPATRRIVRWAALLAVGFAIAACAYRGPADNILSQRATWFSYLGGDDIRASCSPVGPDVYRLVYNADFQRHVRTYDVVVDSGGGGQMRSAIHGGLTFGGPGGIGDLVSRPGVTAPLTPAQTARLVAALEQSDAFGPPPVGLTMSSRIPYWVVVYCRDGAFGLNAWKYPSDRFTAQTFETVIRGLPGTGAAWPELPTPGDATLRDTCDSRALDTASATVCFNITVGADGLAGPMIAF